ncbi:hypothetical protein [Ochrobactrum soli]|uniref:Major tropism determinant second domain-containing protein n=1 Tax=Ochrobactrum soli TaxID=2448455 RepID=A0A849KS23_9HYPH|nr:hypothetical protein [[Ochrobactrum] soli]NNU62457.1 hypothetical protein [[Ochrobactrum] soli]
MMTAASQLVPPTTIKRQNQMPILVATGAFGIGIAAGTTVTVDGVSHAFDAKTPIPFEPSQSGREYGVGIDEDGNPFAVDVTDGLLDSRLFAGFHLAPGSNAAERSGGGNIPAINPYSIWDAGFRPACPDPRGMTRVDLASGKSIWVDVYLLCTKHADLGTSRYGEEIANGDTMDRLDFDAATKIITSHGKRLLTYDEFRTATFGVTERSSADRNPKITGLDAARTSRFGIMQATGNLWVWGTDGDPQDPRPSIFGGSWIRGSDAGSRFADLGSWAGSSVGSVGARGASDHLTLV